MVWFFDRAGGVARLQTTFDNEAQEYMLVIEAPDEPVRTERFATRETYEARLVALERQLRADGWVQRGDVEILDDGWRGPTTRQH